MLEDACQAHGASRDGVRAGTAGRAAAFSFYPSKNLGAMGDAGALVTDDRGLDDASARLREHGQARSTTHESIGYTARLDTIQAIVLLRKLPLLDGLERRAPRGVAAAYGAALDGVGDLRLPPVADDSDPVWHLYVVRTQDPLAACGAPADAGHRDGSPLPEPTHLSEAYASLGHREGAFPVAEALARQCLSLPIFPGSPSDSSTAVAARCQIVLRPWLTRPPTTRRSGCIVDVEFGEDIVVHSFTNLYGCRIGDGRAIGPFVEIQRGAVVGARCKIQSHSFVCEGVTIEDDVFVGHGVMFVNDKHPRATADERRLRCERLGAAADRRRARRVDRLGRRHPRRHSHRRGGPGRGRCSRDARRRTG